MHHCVDANGEMEVIMVHSAAERIGLRRFRDCLLVRVGG